MLKFFSQDNIKNKKDEGAYAGFLLKKGDQVIIKIGTSFSSLDGAKKNLQAEIGNRTFNDIRSKAAAKFGKTRYRR